MSTNIKLVTKSKLQRDYVLPIKNARSIVIDGNAYFYGGTVENNISNIIFYYNIYTKEIIRLPDVESYKEVVAMLKEKDTLAYVDSSGNLYQLDDNGWVFVKSFDLGTDIQAVITEDSQYLITENTVYEYKNQELSVLYESELVSPLDYIPSTDKGIVYFKNGTLNLESGELYEAQNKGDYITYGLESTNEKSNRVVIDKTDSYILSYDSPLIKISKKTIPSNTWYSDYLDTKADQYNPITEILSNGSSFYFSEVSNSIHNVYNVDLNNTDVKKSLFISRTNKSYSKNVQYSHNQPKLIKYKDSVALMGNGGYYYDTGTYDNSVYLSNRPIIELPLDIKSPLYCNYGNSIMVFDRENSSIHQYSYSGTLLTRINVTIEDSNILQFNVFGDDILFRTESRTYIFNTKLNEITKSVNHDTSISSTASRYFVYYIIEKFDQLLLIKESISRNTKECYKLLNKKYDKISLHGDDNCLLLYIEDEENKWEIYRIITNE